MSYEGILSIQSLKEVENPWKGITLNRCIVLAIIIVLVSSGVNEVHDALEVFLEENDLTQMLLGGTDPQPDGTAQLAELGIRPWNKRKTREKRGSLEDQK